MIMDSRPREETKIRSASTTPRRPSTSSAKSPSRSRANSQARRGRARAYSDEWERHTLSDVDSDDISSKEEETLMDQIVPITTDDLNASLLSPADSNKAGAHSKGLVHSSSHDSVRDQHQSHRMRSSSLLSSPSQRSARRELKFDDSNNTDDVVVGYTPSKAQSIMSQPTIALWGAAFSGLGALTSPRRPPNNAANPAPATQWAADRDRLLSEIQTLKTETEEWKNRVNTLQEQVKQMSSAIEQQQEQSVGGEERIEEQIQKRFGEERAQIREERERERLATQEQVRELVGQVAAEQVAEILKNKTAKDIFGHQIKAIEDQQNESAQKLLESSRTELERLTQEFSRRLQSAGSSISDEIYAKFDGLTSKLSESRKLGLEELRAQMDEFSQRFGRALEHLRSEKNEVATIRDNIDSFLQEIRTAKDTMASAQGNRDRCEEILVQVQQLASKALKQKEKEKEEAHISVEERLISEADVKSLVEATNTLQSNYNASQTRLAEVQNTVDSLQRRLAAIESKPQQLSTTAAAAVAPMPTTKSTARLLLEDHAKTLMLALIAFIMMAQLLTQNRPEYPNGYI